MKKGIIVQARMTSTRLPGKVMKAVKGEPLIGYQIERLKACSNVDQIIIATTKNASDDVIVDFCKKRNIDYFRGEENDVLSRYYEAALFFKLDVICRITSDCPLIDPDLVEKAMSYYLNNQSQFDYVTCTDYPLGMSAEVFGFSGLKEAYENAKEPFEREHVTPFFYHNPQNKFKVGRLYPEGKTKGKRYRLTVDTPEDLELIEKILINLHPTKPKFSLEDIYALMKEHPAWARINAHIKQKTLND